MSPASFSRRFTNSLIRSVPSLLGRRRAIPLAPDQLQSDDRDVPRRFDPEPDLAVADRDHGERDAVADYDLLINTS
jgi:hypothetical protein